MLNQPEERSCVSSGLCLAICIRGATGRDRPFLTESQRVGWFGESDTVDSLLWPLERIVKVVEYQLRSVFPESTGSIRFEGAFSGRFSVVGGPVCTTRPPHAGARSVSKGGRDRYFNRS